MEWTKWNIQRWYAQKSVCPRCNREVSNRAYYGSNGHGSAHLKGTCKPERMPKEWPRLAEQKYRLKYSDAPTPGIDFTGETYSDLARWWKVPTRAEAESGGRHE